MLSQPFLSPKLDEGEQGFELLVPSFFFPASVISNTSASAHCRNEHVPSFLF